MAQYSIQDTTLTALGDALRSLISKKPFKRDGMTDTTGNSQSAMSIISPEICDALYKSPKYRIIIHSFEPTGAIYRTSYLNIRAHDINGLEQRYYLFDNEGRNPISALPLTIFNPDYVYFNTGFRINYTVECVNENNETYEYTPIEMVETIQNLKTIPPEALRLTGSCAYRFANDGYNWILDTVGEDITTSGINDTSYMFRNSIKITTIPFDINMSSTDTASMSYMFDGCSKLVSVPNINNANPYSMQYVFSGCSRLREIPENFSDTWNFYNLHTNTLGSITNMFNGAFSLRKIPQKFLESIWSKGTSSSYVPYGTMFYACYTLDEINGLAVQPSALTSNRFVNTFYGCSRIKNLIFQPNQTATWKSQIIDLTNTVGYLGAESYITSYNSGITIDKKVYDDATYQALKNDPDWFTLDLAYSRYNHDSAVATINSLPDTSAYGTNTIKFKGAAGSLTDGGAINTLTTEEIAVATEKGWTVSFV